MNKDKYGAMFNNNSDGSLTISIDRMKRYYPVPTVPLLTTYEYQDVGKNMELRKDVSKFFLENVLKWIKEDKSYNKVKKFESALKSSNGLQIIYNLLRLYVRNGKANWSDLRDTYNYPIVKDYLKYKLENY